MEMEPQLQNMLGAWVRSTAFTFQTDGCRTLEAQSFLNHAPKQQLPDNGKIRAEKTVDRLMLTLFHLVEPNLKAVQDIREKRLSSVHSFHLKRLRRELVIIGKHVDDLVSGPDFTGTMRTRFGMSPSKLVPLSFLMKRFPGNSWHPSGPTK